MGAMASRDPAFLWETEVLRSSERSRKSDSPPSGSGDWVTLREANEATAIPTSTLRKWARNEDIPSYLERSDDGDRRMVSMGGIRRRAAELGRDLNELPAKPRPARRSEARAEERTGAPDEAEQGEGTMLVPLDAWNRMLNQLGNLHEAGQQLAEATERAARAETEATFLRERLAELREELADAKQVPDPGPVPDREPTKRDAPPPTSAIGRIYRSWRVERRRR